MTNDRLISISTAGSRTAAQWKTQRLLWSDFMEKLKTPLRSTESMGAFLAMKKRDQDQLKDVGGFVGGALKDGRRKSNAVLGRDLLTLDLDHIPDEQTGERIVQRIGAMGCGYAIYSTRKHRADKPRLRAIFAGNREMKADEYEPCARKMAEYIGLEYCDSTTFEVARMMYWPSCCSDAPYLFYGDDAPFIDIDGLLNSYENWRDIAQWPLVPGTNAQIQKTAEKQGDPTEKSGVVGAFCRLYNIDDVIDAFLSESYTACEGADRYTYTGGSTEAGAVVYEKGQFLYSHHATDPAGGKLCNAFDLVRLHRFGHLDDEAAAKTPTHNLPSYQAMGDFAVTCEGVQAELSRMLQERSKADFQRSEEDGQAVEALTLDFDGKGNLKKTIDNALRVLRGHESLRNRICLDEFAHRRVVRCPVPWDREEGLRRWTDEDDAGMRWFMEKSYGYNAPARLDDAMAICAKDNRFHEVRDFLTPLVWDGEKRLETLLIDYLGAADTPYTRAVTRKAFAAAVGRVMRPGIKFDYMTILSGAQGIGKSTLLRKMGMSWFSDSIKTFEGKEAVESLQGVWIIEVGELDAMNKSETERVKQFLSQQNDIFRKAYGKHSENYPRQCVFFGTSNKGDYLRDTTGGRRFWPVDVGVQPAQKNVFLDLTEEEVRNIWAEAKEVFFNQEELYLSREMEEAAKQEQEAHREVSPKEGLIREYLEKKLPQNWAEYSLSQRLAFLNGCDFERAQEPENLVERDKVCALEVWCECFGGDVKSLKRIEAREINDILASMEGWRKARNPVRFGVMYGRQKGFIVDNS